jgi:molecular chaperone GrpE
MNTVDQQASVLPPEVHSALQRLEKRDLHDFLGVPGDASPRTALQAADSLLQGAAAEDGDPVRQATRAVAQYCREHFQAQAALPAETPAGASAPPASEAAPHSGPALVDVLASLAALRQEFAAKIRYDATKERQIDKLHSDLQEQKQDVYFKIMRPLLVDLISLQDHLYELLRHPPAEGVSASEERLRSSIRTLADIVDSTLERYDVIAFREEGEAFVAQRQRAERAVDTQDPAQDRCIAERLKKGFLYQGRVLRPELVATYRLKR